MREDGVRLSLRNGEYSELEISVEREPEGTDLVMWLTLEGPDGLPCVQLSPEEAHALAGALTRLAEQLGRHREWQGLNNNAG